MSIAHAIMAFATFAEMTLTVVLCIAFGAGLLAATVVSWRKR